MLSKILEMIGGYMIESRKRKNLTQKDLAELCGLNEGVIRRYEKERYQTCSLSRLAQICTVLEAL